MEKALSIRAVLLDMDGLMLDSEPVYRRAWQSAAAGLGYELSDEFYLALSGYCCSRRCRFHRGFRLTRDRIAIFSVPFAPPK